MGWVKKEWVIQGHLKISWLSTDLNPWDLSHPSHNTIIWRDSTTLGSPPPSLNFYVCFLLPLSVSLGLAFKWMPQTQLYPSPFFHQLVRSFSQTSFKAAFPQCYLSSQYLLQAASVLSSRRCTERIKIEFGAASSVLLQLLTSYTFLAYKRCLCTGGISREVIC